MDGAPGGARSDEIILEPRSFFLDPAVRWFQSSQGEGNHQLTHILANSQGNICVAGGFSGQIQWGTRVFSNNWHGEGYVASFDRDGTFRWAQRVGSPIFTVVNEIASDPTDASYATGTFRQEINVGGLSAFSAGESDMFVAKLNREGLPVWLRRGGGGGYDAGHGIVVDEAGECTVVGVFSGSAAFGPRILVSSGNLDVFVCRYDPLGSVRWVRQAGGADFDYGGHVALGLEGESYIVGTFTDAATFAPGITLNGLPERIPFVACYDADGTLRWVKQPIEFQDRAFVHGVASDRTGHFYLAGGYWGEVAFATNRFTSKGHYSMFLAKYDPNGALQWVRTTDPIGSAVWVDVAVDPMGACLVTGNFSGLLSIAPRLLDLDVTLRSAGSSDDVVIAKFGSDGGLRWIASGGGKSTDYGTGIAANQLGEVFLAASIGQIATFGERKIHGDPWNGDNLLAKLTVEPRLVAPRTTGIALGQPARFSLIGEQAVVYAIESSGNLTEWKALGTVTNSIGRSDLSDSSSMDFDRRFYRAFIAP